MNRHDRRWRTPALLIAVLVTLSACQEPDEPVETPPLIHTRTAPLAAFCDSTVILSTNNRITIDTEMEYLPRVINCENGRASFQALKAQAVSARSYLYYRLERTGDIYADTRDQKYDCNATPGPQHYQAVAETAGEVLTYNGEVIAGFYVAGAIPSAASCVATASDNDPTNTERFVTYNQGQSGSNVTQTTLGLVNPSNFFNRGCKSQNGADCLSDNGWDYRDILRFYYGSDIGFEIAEGACINSISCGTLATDMENILDEEGPCFERMCDVGDSWFDTDQGLDGHIFYTYTIDTAAPQCYGRWSLNMDTAGNYRIEVHLTDIGDMSRQARYRVFHDGIEDSVVLDQEGVNGWVEVGVFAFAGAGEQWLRLDDNTGEPFTNLNGTRLGFDAIRVTSTTDPTTPIDNPEPAPDTMEAPDMSMEPAVMEPMIMEPEPVDMTMEPETDTAMGTDVNAAPDMGTTVNPDMSDVAAPTALGGDEGDDCGCTTTRRDRSLPHMGWLFGVLRGTVAWRRRTS